MASRSLRSPLVLVALAVFLTLPARSAAAATPTRAATGSFCGAMNHFLDFMRSRPRPSALHTPSGRRMLHDLRSTAPRSVARPAKTLTWSLEYVAAHGQHSLSRRRHAAANAALVATARYVVDHCADERITRAYASLLAAAQGTVDAPDAPPPSDWQ